LYTPPPFKQRKITLLISFGLAAILFKAGYQEGADFLKLETLEASKPQDVLDATERIRRVTWRIGLLGAALLMLLLHAMDVKSSSPFSVGIAAWICITSCLNFRAYHVEDVGAGFLKKMLNQEKRRTETHRHTSP
jgi:hypothetical protein